MNDVASRSVTAVTAASRLALAVEGVHKGYRLGETGIPVLRGLDIAVEAGELVAIMGPSGSGKTTLLNCIAAIDEPDAGLVAVGGEPVDFASERARTALRRHRLGIVFQFFNLIPTLTVRENVDLPLRIVGLARGERAGRADALLERVGLAHRADHSPFQLSGGEMQLVSIARALVNRPMVLLADEPTGNVSPAVGASIMDTMRKTAREQETAILLVTHSPEHASWADRVCFLRDGTIAGEMRPAGERVDIAALHRRLAELGI